MKMYNGYPEEVKIDDKDTTLHDVERLLLSLMWDDRLPENDKNHLSAIYRKERQRYLDGRYILTDEKYKVLQDLEQKISDEASKCRERMKRLKQKELDKERDGLLPASGIDCHLEVDNIDLGDSYSDEAVDLWDCLFGEDDRYPMWGFHYMEIGTHVDLGMGRPIEFDNDYKYQGHRSDNEEETVDNKLEAFEELNRLRATYLVAWQDIERIQNLALTINLWY